MSMKSERCGCGSELRLAADVILFYACYPWRQWPAYKSRQAFFFFSLLCAGMKSFVLEFSSKACSLKDLTHAFVVVHYFSSHLPGNQERLFFFLKSIADLWKVCNKFFISLQHSVKDFSRVFVHLYIAYIYILCCWFYPKCGNKQCALTLVCRCDLVLGIGNTVLKSRCSGKYDLFSERRLLSIGIARVSFSGGFRWQYHDIADFSTDNFTAFFTKAA